MHGYIQNYIRTVLIKTPENRLASHFNICAFAHDYSILINIFCLQKIKLFLELTQNYKSLKIWRKMSRKISKNIARQSKTLYELSISFLRHLDLTARIICLNYQKL